MATRSELNMRDYIASTGSAIADLRLLVEGALYLYSEETESLFWLARKNDQLMAAQSLTAIGTALRLLRSNICAMEKAYVNEIQRRPTETSVP